MKSQYIIYGFGLLGGSILTFALLNRFLKSNVNVYISKRIKAQTRQWWYSTINKIISNYHPIIKHASAKYGVPERIIISVILQESQGNPRAYRYESNVNDASRGLMQILYRTAVGLGYQGSPDGLFNPEINIDLGTKYLRQNYDRYGSWPFAVAGYNSGGRIKQASNDLGTNDWEEIVMNADKLLQINSKRYSGFVKYTIPYLINIFGEGGILDILSSYQL